MTWFHNFDSAGTHMSYLIDLATALTNDTADKIVWNVYLLSLKLLLAVG